MANTSNADTDLGLEEIPSAQNGPTEADELGLEPVPEPRPEPDMTPMKEYFKGNLEKARAENKSADGQPKVASTFLEDIEAGWQMSVSGLAIHGDKPNVVLPEHASSAATIAAGIPQLVGDLPAMIPGFFAGAAAGSALPVVGTAVGGMAGANAAPAAVRKILMDHYEKGDIQDAKEFLDRASSTLWETAKAGAVGAIAGKAGEIGGKLAAPVLSTVGTKLAAVTSEIGAMTTANSAFEGHLPNAKEFVDAGLLVAAVHAITHVGGTVGGTKAVASKMRATFGETGLKPEQIAEDAKNNAVIQQELLMDNGEIPSPYKPLVEVGPKPSELGAIGSDVTPPKVEGTKRTEAEKKILSQVGEQSDGTRNQKITDKAYQDYVDKFDPIKKAQEVLTEHKEELPADKNPYMLTRMANDAPAKVKHVIENGTLDFKTLEKNGEGLKQIVSEHVGDMEGLDAYLLAKRHLELNKRGIESGFDHDAATQVVKEGKFKYDNTAKRLVEFQNRNLQYAKDAGLLSEVAYKNMAEEGKAYIPFKRVLDPVENTPSKGKPSSLKKIKGSSEKVQTPMLSVMENTETLFRLGEKNRAIESFVKLAEENPEASMIERVSSVKEENLTPEEMTAALEKSNKPKKGEAAGEFEVFRDGKRITYKTTPELAEAFNALGGDKTAVNMLMKMAQTVTTLKKIGITTTPDFIVKNVFRDQFTAAAFSKGGSVPFWHVASAIGDLVKKNDTYYNWLKSGGAGGSFIDLNESYLKTDILKLNKETGILDSVWNQAKKPVEKMLAASQLLEHATRLAEFKQVTKGATSGEKVFEGGMSSREVTLDFSRTGAKISALNSITAFMNVGIQGFDKTARALKENPVGVTSKALMYITAPTLLLWYANKDDERYASVPNWEKDRFWHIITDSWQDATPEDHADGVPEHLRRLQNGKLQINKGSIYRLPMPQELGLIFGAAPRRLMDKFFTDHPDQFKGFMGTIYDMVKPNIVPDVVSPVIEQFANKSLFTGHEIIPGHLEKVAPQYQYTEYTSETSKALGKMTAYIAGEDAVIIPPAVLDNYVQSWTGPLGKYMLQIADQGLIKSGVVPNKNRAEGTLADIPFIKAFVSRYPGTNAQQIVDFRERYDRVQQKINTLNLLKKTPGLQSDYQSYFQSMHADEFVQMTDAKKALGEAGKLIHSINENPDIPPKEKRQLIDGQYHFMIQLAKNMNSLSAQLEKAADEAEKKIKGTGDKGGRSPQSMGEPTAEPKPEEDVIDINTDEGVEQFDSMDYPEQIALLSEQKISDEDKTTMAKWITESWAPEHIQALPREQYAALERFDPEGLRDAMTAGIGSKNADAPQGKSPKSANSGKELRKRKATKAEEAFLKKNPEYWGGIVK